MECRIQRNTVLRILATSLIAPPPSTTTPVSAAPLTCGLLALRPNPAPARAPLASRFPPVTWTRVWTRGQGFPASPVWGQTDREGPSACGRAPEPGQGRGARGHWCRSPAEASWPGQDVQEKQQHCPVSSCSWGAGGCAGAPGAGPSIAAASLGTDVGKRQRRPPGPESPCPGLNVGTETPANLNRWVCPPPPPPLGGGPFWAQDREMGRDGDVKQHPGCRGGWVDPFIQTCCRSKPTDASWDRDTFLGGPGHAANTQSHCLRGAGLLGTVSKRRTTAWRVK